MFVALAAASAALAASDSASRTSASYSGTFTYPIQGFHIRVSFHLSLGRPSTNTSGESPPYVNVAVPVSGGGAATNVTPGYSVGVGGLVPIGVFELVPKASPLCTMAEADEVDKPTGLCAFPIAEFAYVCTEDLQQIPPNVTLPLRVYPVGPSMAVDPGMEPDTCDPSQFRVLTASEIAGLRPSTAKQVMKELAAPPRYWVVGYELQGDEGIEWYKIAGSQPAGVRGVLANSNNNP
jgi:hypothetical protein